MTGVEIIVSEIVWLLSKCVRARGVSHRNIVVWLRKG